MFIGRKTELALLDDMYGREDFQFLVMYGRRRVGKTSAILTFIDAINYVKLKKNYRSLLH